MPAQILSIQVGLPADLNTPNSTDGHNRQWRSAIYKLPVSGPVAAGPNGLAGDGQADLRVHGGPDKAVYAYPSEHYRPWQAELGLAEMPNGAFGENLTTLGLLEDEVCIGDVLQAGLVRLQVSQPRGPCWKLARRWGIVDLALRFGASGRTGFYLRLLQPGELEAGQALLRVERPCPDWNVRRAHFLLEDPTSDRPAAASLAELPQLSQSCRKDLVKKLAL